MAKALSQLEAICTSWGAGDGSFEHFSEMVRYADPDLSLSKPPPHTSPSEAVKMAGSRGHTIAVDHILKTCEKQTAVAAERICTFLGRINHPKGPFWGAQMPLKIELEMEPKVRPKWSPKWSTI